MKKKVLSAVALVAYIALLIRVMVFKDIPPIKIGQLMLNFGGAESGHAANLVPFTTIVPYLFGFKGWIIAGVNLVGNIAPLVPLGFLVVLMYPRTTWKGTLMLGIAASLAIETVQTVLRVGVFDIDDVILNTFGVMLGYWAFRFLAKWLRERSYIKIVVVALILIAAALAAFYSIYPWGQPVTLDAGVDLCGGTGGIGHIVSIGTNAFTIERKDGSRTAITLASGATIKTPAGIASMSDLQIGQRVTLVGDSNSDKSFTANVVLVCS